MAGAPRVLSIQGLLLPCWFGKLLDMTTLYPKAHSAAVWAIAIVSPVAGQERPGPGDSTSLSPASEELQGPRGVQSE